VQHYRVHKGQYLIKGSFIFNTPKTYFQIYGIQKTTRGIRKQKNILPDSTEGNENIWTLPLQIFEKYTSWERIWKTLTILDSSLIPKLKYKIKIWNNCPAISSKLGEQTPFMSLFDITCLGWQCNRKNFTMSVRESTLGPRFLKFQW